MKQFHMNSDFHRSMTSICGKSIRKSYCVLRAINGRIVMNFYQLKDIIASLS